MFLTLSGTWMGAPRTVSASAPAAGLATPAADQLLLERLQAASQGGVRVSYHADTGKVRYIGADRQHPLAVEGSSAASGPTAEGAARAFVNQYGALFGLVDPTAELRVMDQTTTAAGRAAVRFQQVHRGIPVLGGELRVNLDRAGNVLAANGEISPEPAVDITPALTAEAAQVQALALVAKWHGVAPERLTASTPALWLFDPALLGAPGPRGVRLVWRSEVRSADLAPIRELVLIDAQTGRVALHFSQNADSKSRVVYDNRNQRSAGLPGYGPVRGEGQGASGISDVDLAYEYSGDTYDFYWIFHQRDSLDGAGMTLVSTARYCSTDATDPCPYPNAFWNGEQMVYGAGYASADDVVAHELTHGVTEHTSNVFYYMQSGAISESLSDIWGEFVDLTNGHGDDSAQVRWLIGEDLPDGIVRDMRNPHAYGDPERTTDSRYYCGAEDGGGVHRNSSVINKTASLMTDGGAFNGRTVTGLGIAKTAAIWYETQTQLLTSAADFQDLYDLLPQACTNLIGAAGITSADCQQVALAVAATELNLQPSACPIPDVPACDAGQTPVDLFLDNFENLSSGLWVSGATVGANIWYYPQTNNPYNYPLSYATSGRYHLWGDDNRGTRSDAWIRMTRDISLPTGAEARLHFRHAYSFEQAYSSNYDGGVLEYSTDSGSTWRDTTNLLTNNGYTGQITGSSNPLLGRSAFVGPSYGYIASRLNLSSLAGKKIRFRFRLATDSMGGDWGWFIDDVRIYTCNSSAGTATPMPTAPATVTATRTPTATATVTAPSTPAAVRQRNYLPHIAWEQAYATPTPTPTATPGHVLRTLPAIADAEVSQGAPDWNAGAAARMRAGCDFSTGANGGVVRSLVRFDLSSIPAGAIITSARLRVFYEAFWDWPGYVDTVTAYRVTSGWEEPSVNWTLQPSYAAATTGIVIPATEEWGWYELTVTPLVQGWVAQNTPNYGVILRGPEYEGDDASWRGFSTREGSYPPELVIDYLAP